MKITMLYHCKYIDVTFAFNLLFFFLIIFVMDISFILIRYQFILESNRIRKKNYKKNQTNHSRTILRNTFFFFFSFQHSILIVVQRWRGIIRFFGDYFKNTKKNQKSSNLSLVEGHGFSLVIKKKNKKKKKKNKTRWLWCF